MALALTARTEGRAGLVALGVIWALWHLPLSLHTSSVAWLTVLMLWVGAAYLLVRVRGVRTIAGFDGAPLREDGTMAANTT